MAFKPSTLISSPLPLFTTAALLRTGMLLYGLWQDANSPLKYTDIDYLVFTDAARFTFTPSILTSSSSSSSPSSPQYALFPPLAASPYTRETYRYTPLLAWLLYPTTWTWGSSAIRTFWFSSGKILFALADLVAGWFIIRILENHHGGSQRMMRERACRFASIWLLNPMVATISTRGSSEGLLGVLVTALLWTVLERQVIYAGVLLGLGVHFKIYPFIYAPAVAWWMDAERMSPVSSSTSSSKSPKQQVQTSKNKSIGGLRVGGNWITSFLTKDRITLTLVSLLTFWNLNVLMYMLYGVPFVTHTYLHHVTRIDHRHNFSVYNVLLYLTSSLPEKPALGIESIAFLPQLFLSCVLLPLVGAKKDLATTMLAQTFAFVTFNKVCTSQYFLWYMVFLPLYLPNSTFLKKPILGVSTLVLWIATQGLWLQQGYNLEFLGLSTFVPGLWLSSLAFYAANCFILGIIIDDLAAGSSS
ncbi:glycosyltransferase family 50 protein [Xylariaceae sp. FL0255]|nr:glycosyltransferase family 50 protein [Xylariaceae sp. FL0255]